ncbi:Pre-mRNA-splicing factor syf2 [Sphaceloma murrayae]|uniref:Pre-mRNA-splicing factor SYF2 n=1 Tax=Sphaceloma murrayae TaxID=2082308 RepID=A0A2K1QSF2_9PEZI|nr:Pre-mRNA-splicing factor syf2 [Sphaceloma murrayae]
MAEDKSTSPSAEPANPSSESTTTVKPPSPDAKPSTTSPAADDRKARFAALRARNSESRKANLSETKSEHARLTTDTSMLSALNRKKDVAAQKLLKADTAAAGEDFERKRAWDWTVEESEKWDRRMGKKSKHRDDTAFADFRAEARKTYKRQLRDLKPDTEGYEREKAEMIERAAQGGNLEIVETADGELIAIDRDGTFYSTAENTEFVGNKPSKEAVDRLVDDLKKAEAAKLKKLRERRGKEEDGDVSYINEKNKQFNQKLARFYDKYTADIRESFERGTAI